MSQNLSGNPFFNSLTNAATKSPSQPFKSNNMTSLTALSPNKDLNQQQNMNNNSTYGTTQQNQFQPQAYGWQNNQSNYNMNAGQKPNAPLQPQMQTGNSSIGNPSQGFAQQSFGTQNPKPQTNQFFQGSQAVQNPNPPQQGFTQPGQAFTAPTPNSFAFGAQTSGFQQNSVAQPTGFQPNTPNPGSSFQSNNQGGFASAFGQGTKTAESGFQSSLNKPQSITPVQPTGFGLMNNSLMNQNQQSSFQTQIPQGNMMNQTQPNPIQNSIQPMMGQNPIQNQLQQNPVQNQAAQMQQNQQGFGSGFQPIKPPQQQGGFFGNQQNTTLQEQQPAQQEIPNQPKITSFFTPGTPKANPQPATLPTAQGFQSFGSAPQTAPQIPQNFSNAEIKPLGYQTPYPQTNYQQPLYVYNIINYQDPQMQLPKSQYQSQEKNMLFSLPNYQQKRVYQELNYNREIQPTFDYKIRDLSYIH